jgi:glycosyltransferase involved in cell wall biosynthesis
MQRVELAVVIPVGPTCDLENVLDTLESVRHYVTPSHVIIVLDDSGKGTGLAVREHFGDVVVLTTEKNYGKDAGLYLNLSRGFAYAYENYSFDVLLRLDTDALVIGPNLDKDAIEHLANNPDLGIFGSYRTDCNGDPRDFSWSRNQLAKEIGLESALRDFPRRWTGWRLLRKAYHQGRLHGYEPGEHCMGGAYFISRACIGRLLQNNLLSRQEIAWSKLQEDMLFGLFIYAIGLKHGDFATGRYPMGLRWRGLPCSPEDLVAQGKKVTHSTRFFGGLNERAIRAYFRARRQSEAA